MAKDKPHKETIIDQPSMTTIVTKEYLIPPFTEVVIHKKFFLFWTAFVAITISALWGIGLWTNWYHQAGLSIWQFQWSPKNWLLWLVEAFTIGTLSTYAYMKHRKKLTSKEKQRLEEFRKRFPNSEVNT